MLQKIRDKITGWIAGVIIALVAGAFMLWGIESYFQQGSGDQNTAATVNSVEVTNAQVNNAFSEIQKQVLAESKGRPLDDQMTQQLKSYALQSLITQTALITTFTNEGFRVGLTQVESVVGQAPQFQDNGKFSQEKFMQMLYQANLTPAQFFQHIQSQWTTNQVMGAVVGSAFALPSEVDNIYALQHQQRAFGYFIIPAQSFISKIKITDADIKSYYDAHQTEYQTPATVSVAYLELAPADIEKNVTVTEAEAKSYFESHLASNSKQSFASVKNKVMALLKHQKVNEILTKKSSVLADLTYTNPNSLTAAAKTLNLPVQMSPMMTKSGAKTGVFANPAVLAAVFSDSVFQSNNNSNVIDLGKGQQIVLRILKKVPAQAIPLATESAKIRTILSEKQASAQAGLLAYRVQKKLSTGVNPATVAAQNKLQWHAVALMPFSEKSTTPIAIMTTAFSIPPKNPQAVLINKNDYAVITVNQVKIANAAQADAAKKQKLSVAFSGVWGKLLQHSFITSVMTGSHIVVKKA
ncbi:MAG: SurA N-terminal domain-containing protein [Gammaproteobacteria bacterium]|nr:SurA N-terminal domain-containing protein [Gammaproteobacteria bacterium]